MRATVLIGLLVTCCAVAGCGQSRTTPVSPQPPSGPLLLSLAETLPDRELQIFVRTEEQYPCMNFSILSSVDRRPTDLELGFWGVSAPMICLTATGPARTMLDLGRLPEGRQALHIKGVAGNADLGLEVTADAYGVLGRPGPGIRFEEIEVRRVPKGTIWGSFGFASEDLRPIVEAILAEMESLGARPHALAPGRYTVSMEPGWLERFRIRTSGDIEREGASGYYVFHTFALDYTGDRNELRDLVARVGTEFGVDLHLLLFTGQGDVFMSWAPTY